MKRILFIFICFILTGCKEAAIKVNLEQLAILKVQVVQQSSTTPYRRDHYELFKSYFSQIQDGVVLLEEEPKAAKKLNKALEKISLEKFCTDVLVSKTVWNEIVKNCTQNNYFLCSEDVENYVNSVKSLRGYLEPQGQQLFDNSAACYSIIQ